MGGGEQEFEEKDQTRCRKKYPICINGMSTIEGSSEQPFIRDLAGFRILEDWLQADTLLLLVDMNCTAPEREKESAREG